MNNVYKILLCEGMIMSFVNINVRMDQDLKKAFEEFCNDVGLSMSGVFTLFAKKNTT